MSTWGSAKAVGVVLNLVRDQGIERQGEPVTLGVPWPRGAVWDPGMIVREDRADLVQVQVTDRWEDGSIRWSAVDVRFHTGDAVTLAVRSGSAPEARGRLVVTRTGDQVAVDTGAACFVLRPEGTVPFDQVTVGGRRALDVPRSGLALEDHRGLVLSPRCEALALEAEGLLRATVRCTGTLDDALGRRHLRFVLRCHFVEGSATVRFAFTLHNPRAACHPEGRWELGNKGSVLFRHATWRWLLPDAAPAAVRWTDTLGGELERSVGPVSIHQESSGGVRWQSSVHLDRDRMIPMRFRGYEVRAPERTHRGGRATPVVAVDASGLHLAAAFRNFWETFPKRLDADDDEVALGLFPSWGGLHELQGGERSTSAFAVAFAPDAVTQEPLAWVRAPVLLAVPPSWVEQTRSVPWFVPRDQDPCAGLQALQALAVEGPESFLRKREAVDLYGWRHYGELWADHEAVYHPTERPLVSHYNNQYDASLGLGLAYLRTGDPRYWDLFEALDQHVRDIDTYHTDEDKSAYNHGQFWHTCHHVDADLSTHRTYPGTHAAGGGPSGGHLYAGGHALYHLLTGSADAREAVVSLGRYVIDADDGTQTPFRWIDSRPTGHVTQAGNPWWHGANRATGNCLETLVRAHRLTDENRYLAKAEEVLHRAVHPDDDPGAMGFDDAETYWFYTMFLVALGHYLDHKVERGQLDARYAYGRACLLTYARWMADHERPTLASPQRLEFPTETWAAQDLRKVDVLHLASRHADQALRARLRARAEVLYDAAVAALEAAPTRGLCRPLVLCLTQGGTHGYAKLRLVEPAPAPGDGAEGPWPEKVPFVTQKSKVKKRLVLIAATGGAVLAYTAGEYLARRAWRFLRELAEDREVFR